jgi:DNA polymerase-3 subunit delta
VTQLLGDDDRTLALESYEVPSRNVGGEESDAGGAEARRAAVDAARNAALTPPFMTERRVVVLRDVGNLLKDEAAPLVAYLDDPSPTSELVLVAGGGTIVKSLEEAVRAHGEIATSGSEKAVDVLARELDEVGLSLEPDAAKAVLAHVGGDAGLLPGLVETLASVHGANQTLDVDAVTPYLGDEGAVPMWDLTNAIERGDIPQSLVVLQRLLTVTSPTQPRRVHPLQVMGMLHTHYRRLLRLDDPGITSNDQAAEALGGRMKPAAAGFRLRQARALGTEGLRQAFDHLAQADLDLKGQRATPEDAVLEVLVARLARLSATGGAGRAGGGRRARSG